MARPNTFSNVALLTLAATIHSSWSTEQNYSSPRHPRRIASIPAYSGTATYALDKECDGLDGTCAMAACKTRDTKPTCAFTPETFTASEEVKKFKCQTCTQTPSTTDERCSTAFLSSVLKSNAGVQAAYCNDKNLVILTDGSPSHTPDLDKVVIPPSGTVGGVECVTRSWSPKMAHYKIPVVGKYTLLGTADRNNNANTQSFPGGAGKDGYLSHSKNGVYGLPQSGSSGVTIAGEDVFPVFSDQVVLTPESCEVDSCQEHVGKGGGAPHLHGDPFSKTAGKCLYSPADYAGGVTAHPPLVGFSLDGPSIYGRYLSTSSPGYGTMDDCGGHVHTIYLYHYHASVQSGAATSKNKAKAATGTEFPAFPFGPDQCWKADISKTAGFWEKGRAPSEYTKPCCGMTEYWVKSGVTIDGAGTQNTTGVTAGAGGTAATGGATSTGGAATTAATTGSALVSTANKGDGTASKTSRNIMSAVMLGMPMFAVW